MTGIVSDGFIIPAFCGPLGIFPLRVRARIACAVHDNSSNNALLAGGLDAAPMRNGYRMSC